MVTIKKIDVGSAFKVGAILSLLIALIFGLIGFGLQALFLLAFSSMGEMMQEVDPSFSSSDLEAFGAVSVVFLCIGYFVSAIVSAIFGGIFGAIGALMYNLTSGWVGGLQVELEDEYKDKPGFSDF